METVFTIIGFSICLVFSLIILVSLVWFLFTLIKSIIRYIKLKDYSNKLFRTKNNKKLYEAALMSYEFLISEGAKDTNTLEEVRKDIEYGKQFC